MTALLEVVFLVMVLLVSSVFPADGNQPLGPAYVYGAEGEKTVSFILTSDLHAHVQPVSSINEEGKTVNLGGFAPLKAQIDKIKKSHPDSFLLDGGDFSMGTVYQTIEQTKAPELMLMGMMGYDVVNLGEHEFDYGVSGLAAMLNVAKTGGRKATTERVYNEETYRYETKKIPGYSMPKVVSSNVDFRTMLERESLAEGAQALKAAFRGYGVQDYVVLKKGGVRVAVFGLVGNEAGSHVSTSGVVWQDPVERARRIVAEIRRNKEADIIVCLSHSGMEGESPAEAAGEDVELAEQVPGIDLILSGHSHLAYEEPVQVGNTVIVSVGRYGENLGHLVLAKGPEGTRVESFALTKVDGSAGTDGEIKKEADAYKAAINSQYLSGYGYSYDQALVTCPFPLPEGIGLEEDGLGNLMADAYIYRVKQEEGENYRTVDVAVVSRDSISGELGEGSITAASVFGVSSYGMGEDGKAGYPLVGFYLSGRELKTLAEMDVSLSAEGRETGLSFSGLKYAYNTHRMRYNRAMDVVLLREDGTEEKIDNKKLYRVVADQGTVRAILNLSEEARGMVKVTPKDEEGHSLYDIREGILTGSAGELKAWHAVATYLDSFEGDVVPERYASPMGRKVNETSFNPIKLLKQPNRFTIVLLVLVLVPLLILVLLVMLIRRHREKHRGYKRSMFGGANWGNNRGKPVFKGKKYNRKKLFK